ncbi:hypothetical protein ABFS83_08G007300 [Erythranthe nasuta]
MDYRHANLCCVLKVHSGCDACKRQTMEVLSSIDGVYDVTIDAETKTAKITGEVDPNYCIKALARCGVHAELVWANLSHPKMNNRGPYDHDYGSYAYNYYGEKLPYGNQRSLPEGMWHETPGYVPPIMRNGLPEYSYNGPPMRNRLPEYSRSNNYYYYDEAARHYPPRIDYNNPYVDQDSMNLCTIM